MNTNNIKSWTPLFTSIMKLLHYGIKIIEPNATILRIITNMRVDKIIYSKPKYIKYHKVITNTNKTIGEWIWNTNKITDIKSHSKYIFYIHGGAFCAGNMYNIRGFLYQLAKKTNVVIFSANYKKAPEYKHPIPLTDCIEGFTYFINQIKNIDEKPTIIIMGDSAGGNLSINLIAHLIKSNLLIPSACILISPWVNLSDCNNSSSWIDNEKYDFVKYEFAKYFAFEYINQETNTLEDVSPLYLHDDILIKFPPILIEYGEYETLRDQIQEFSIKLEKLGLNITYNSRYEMTHNYPMFYFTKILQANDFFCSVKKFIKKIENLNI